MAKVVLVGYGKMLYSLIKGIDRNKHQILGVLRADRSNYSPFELFFKDIFNPGRDYIIIKGEKLKDIKAPKVNSKEFIKEIKKLKPDLILTGSWGEKFNSEILSMLPCINFHPALLPKNRGANPYFWSIYLNQKVSGLTIHFMNEKFDKGKIIMQEAITIDDNETGMSLKNKTTALAKVMVNELLDLFDSKQLQPIEQDEKFASYESQINTENMILDLNQSSKDVYRHLRALYPWANPIVKTNKGIIRFKKAKFIPVDSIVEANKKKINEIVEAGKDYVVIKGSDFLLKIFK